MADEIPIPDISYPDMCRMLGERDVMIARLTATVQSLAEKQSETDDKGEGPTIRYVAGDAS